LCRYEVEFNKAALSLAESFTNPSQKNQALNRLLKVTSYTKAGSYRRYYRPLQMGQEERKGCLILHERLSYAEGQFLHIPLEWTDIGTIAVLLSHHA
jgi:FixJ family two-component response regulator